METLLFYELDMFGFSTFSRPLCLGDIEEFLIQADPNDKKSAWRCLICGKDYQNKPNCRRHIETQHFDAPSVKCDICGKTLKNQNSYQNHMVIVHGHNKGARKNNFSHDPLFQ